MSPTVENPIETEMDEIQSMPVPFRNRNRMKIIALMSLITASAILVAKSESKPAETRIEETETIHRRMQAQSLSASYPHIEPLDFLSSSSTILITGAAGFIGSNLAVSLYRTYSPKHIILVDSLDADPPPLEEFDLREEMREPETSVDLSLLEYKRQRIFWVLQTLGSSGSFYKADLRRSIPEFYKTGDVPILESIWNSFPDITHVVHLADEGLVNYVMPKTRDVTKAGMMESILEAVKVVGDKGRPMPHVVYGSSYEVYASSSKKLTETSTLYSPSSFKGANKLVSEILAKTYGDMYGVYSVGLRFFNVYGPWGDPQSRLFNMAERAVTGDRLLEKGVHSDYLDYVYIDDAIDAIFSAMQYRPPKLAPEKYWTPTCFNVGTGISTHLQALHDLLIKEAPSKQNKQPQSLDSTKPSIFIADISQSTVHLGYTPRVPLTTGIRKMLAWHFDRGTPYSTDPPPSNLKPYASAQCNPYDTQCMLGAPIFPCSSECAKQDVCLPSAYDEIIVYTKLITQGCKVVLFTISIGDITRIPSATFGVLPNHDHYHVSPKGDCNLAFVSTNSQLWTSRNSDAKHGFWKLIGVPTAPLLPKYEAELPKFSPGSFFSDTVKHTIYISPNTLPRSVSKIVDDMTSNSISYMTSLKQQPEKRRTPAIQLQERAYNMVYIAFSGKLPSSVQSIDDTTWIATELKSEDIRLFRCDVMAEVVGWKVDTLDKSLLFVAGLHDLWVRALREKKKKGTRRLEEEMSNEENEKNAFNYDNEEENKEEGENEEDLVGAEEGQTDRLDKKKDDGLRLNILGGENNLNYFRAIKDSEDYLVDLNKYSGKSSV